MTFTGEDDVIDAAVQAPAPASGPAPVPAKIRLRRPRRSQPARPQPVLTPAPRASDSAVRSVGVAITLLAVAILGFVGYLYVLSGAQEARAQTTLYAKLQGQLGQGIAPAGPEAPTGPDGAMQPVQPGDPMALLSISSIGLRNLVVVYGTSPEDLTAGPGLLRDTPLPGQSGISVIFGRRATFGAPFARLPQLRPGAQITAVTSQGTATYQVIDVASSRKAVPFRSYANQLLLVTADSRISPSHYVEVEAKLVTAVQPTPTNFPAIGASEVALGRDASALIPAMAWAIALAAAAALGTVLASRWSRWPAWIATIPVIIAILWNLYQCLTALLPNLY